MGDIAAPGRARSGSGSSWYTNSYGNMTRTSRIRQSPFMPGGNRITPTADVTIPLEVTPTVPAANTGKVSRSRGGKKGETLFGPDLGLEEGGEDGWTEKDQGGGVKVPLGVVRGWVEGAKKEVDGVHQTTTLQALVNLKRPTLTLVPLSADSILPSSTPQRNSFVPTIRHTLKFSYDSSSPKVLIIISQHPRFANHGQSSIISQGIHPGGFGLDWELPIEEALDIGAAMDDEKRAEASLASMSKKLDGEGSEGSDIEDDIHNPVKPSAPTHIETPVVPIAESTPVVLPERSFMDRVRRRHHPSDLETGIIAGIRRQQGGAENIPMGDLTLNAATKEEEEETPVKEEEGMRIVIRLEAIGQDGEKLSVINAQATHVLLTGTLMPSSTPVTAGRTEGEGLEAVSEEIPAAGQETMKRVWYIKVVRREALIGNHTFLLKEIYGLASSSSNATTAPAPVEPHGPTSGTEEPPTSTPNECIVCLTNPRDVVLLPCRHLVVCRECALGMIEFGAGGKVARRGEEEAVGGAGGAEEGATGGSTALQGVTAAASAVTGTGGARERRKKKGKGWFCPVCRQPYTSLLRLALPSTKEDEMETVELEQHQHDHELSRQPSIAANSIRSVRRSLHRSSSRATLPERGERMLQDLAPDDDDEEHETRGQQQQEAPQFVLGQEVEVEGRRSVEGKGWKQV